MTKSIWELSPKEQQWARVATMVSAVLPALIGTLMLAVAYETFRDEGKVTLDIATSVCVAMVILVGAMVIRVQPPRGNRVVFALYYLLYAMVCTAGLSVAVWSLLQ